MLLTIHTRAGRQDIDVKPNEAFAAMRKEGSPTFLPHIEGQLNAPVAAGDASVLQQMAEQMGITPGTSLHDAVNGTKYRGPEGASASTVGGDGSVVGRLVTQAILFNAIE